MWIFNSVFGKVFEMIFYPFRNMSPWIGMIFVSLLTGFMMLFVFRWTSNQEGIKNIKNKIKAHLLELRLYKDSMSTSLKAQGNILRCNLRYIGYSAKPMLVMIVPLILIIVQLNFWFGYESLSIGKDTILKIKMDKEINLFEAAISVEPTPGIVFETLPVRIEGEQEISWRFSTTKAGLLGIYISVNGEKLFKKVSVSLNQLRKISPIKIRRSFLKEALYPAEPPINKDSSIESVEIGYPSKKMNLFGWHIHWLIAYFALSIIFGFALKGILRVEI
ncbi:hypothetical protein ACFLRM_04420 [Acidobacteriota bacterium]